MVAPVEIDGLSPAELQVLQSLGNRRGELDQREQGLDTQVQLIAAAEAKLDERIKDMNQLKSNIQDLLGQADTQQQAEIDRLVTVYEAMKPKDAAARMTLMDDSVRLPMATRIKPRKLADILANMPVEDAKNLSEKLAQRVNKAQAVTDARAAMDPAAAPSASGGASSGASNATTPPAALADAATPADKPAAKSKSKTPKAVAANDKGASPANDKGAPAAKPAGTSAPAAKSG